MKTHENHYNAIIEANLEKMSVLVNNLKICDECDVVDIGEWLERNFNDSGFKIYPTLRLLRNLIM